MALVFRVPGEPIPQPRPRFCSIGGLPRAYVPAGHPVHAYREAVRLAALAAGVKMATGPVEVSVLFVFGRPPSHLAADGSLRRTAPLWPVLRCGDADNLGKAIGDSLIGVAYRDDSQVDFGFLRRRYWRSGFTEITIAELSPADYAGE